MGRFSEGEEITLSVVKKVELNDADTRLLPTDAVLIYSNRILIH
jgi:hypothetical protein